MKFTDFFQHTDDVDRFIEGGKWTVLKLKNLNSELLNYNKIY